MKGRNVLTLVLIALLIATVFAGCSSSKSVAALEDWATAVENASFDIATKMTAALESGDGEKILELAIEYRDTLRTLIDQGKLLDQSELNEDQKKKLTSDIAVLESSLEKMNTIIKDAEESPELDAAAAPTEPTEPTDENQVPEQQEPEEQQVSEQAPEQLTETPAA